MAVKRIVLTGGPGAGKTVIALEIARMHPDRFVLVPEAATLVYGQGGTRWDLLDVEGQREMQRRIYWLQIQQEERLAEASPGKVLLLDRGTVDGAAYWPGGAEGYWSAMRTTLPRELSRYDAAVWMESAAAVGCYDGAASNACRYEDPTAAIACGEAVRSLWAGHPRLAVVGARERMDEKIDEVTRLVMEWMR